MSEKIMSPGHEVRMYVHEARFWCPAERLDLGRVEGDPGALVNLGALVRGFVPADPHECSRAEFITAQADGSILMCPRCRNPVVIGPTLEDALRLKLRPTLGSFRLPKVKSGEKED